MSNRSPFRPGFGESPEVLAGRDELIAGVVGRLDDTVAGFSLGFVGDRGVGKTVLLNAIEHRAATMGWAVVHRQARTDAPVVDELNEALPEALRDAWGGASRLDQLIAEVTIGANVGLAKVEAKVKRRESVPASSAYALERALRKVGRHARDNHYDAGVLITLDEAHQTPIADLAVIGSVMQLVTGREELPVVLLLAGLPQLSEALQRSGTYLERLEIDQVGLLDRAQSRIALRDPIVVHGRSISRDALDELLDAAGGYPYFLQLFGHHTWEASTGASVLTVAHARAGLAAATAQIDRIFAARWNAIPAHQQAYLQAMAAEGGDVIATSAVNARLGKTPQQVSVVRDRLIHDHHIIRAVGRGQVAFTLPGFRDWLRG